MDYNGFFYDVTDEEDYQHIHRTILDCNMMNISLIIMEGNYCAIDSDDYSFNGYYIIKFYSYPYILQEGLSVCVCVLRSPGCVLLHNLVGGGVPT